MGQGGHHPLQETRGQSIDRVYPVEFKDGDGDLVASIEKTIYIRRK